MTALTDLDRIVSFVGGIAHDYGPAYSDELAFIGTLQLFGRRPDPDLCESGAIYRVPDARCYDRAACRYTICVKLGRHWLAGPGVGYEREAPRPLPSHGEDFAGINDSLRAILHGPSLPATDGGARD